MREPHRHFFKRHQVSRVAFKINRSFHWNKPIYSKFKGHRANVLSLLFSLCCMLCCVSNHHCNGLWVLSNMPGALLMSVCVWASLMSATVKQRCLGILTLTSGSRVSGSTEMLRAASRQWRDHGVDSSCHLRMFAKMCLCLINVCSELRGGDIWCCWPASSCLIISPKEWLRLQEKTIIIIICERYVCHMIYVPCSNVFSRTKVVPAYWLGYLILRLRGEGMKDVAVVQPAPSARSSCSVLCPPQCLNCLLIAEREGTLGGQSPHTLKSPLGCQLLSYRTF